MLALSASGTHGRQRIYHVIHRHLRVSYQTPRPPHPTPCSWYSRHVYRATSLWTEASTDGNWRWTAPQPLQSLGVCVARLAFYLDPR
jgi:hypothetical protein